MVGWESCCHRRGNMTPTPHRIITKLPPLLFLTFCRVRRHDSSAASTLSCPCRTQRGRGVAWVRHRGGAEGWGGCFGGCVGEWRRLFLHTSPSLRSPPWLSPSFLWLPFFLCCLFWSWSDLPPFVPYYGCICFNTNRRRSHTHDSHANIASYPQTWIRSASVSSVIVRETVLPRLAMWMSARVALWVVDTHHFITQEIWASRFT